MSSPPPPPRRIVPPTVTPRSTPALAPDYFRRKFEPPRMDRWKRNLLVWGLCAIIIIAVVVMFVRWMVPPQTQEILNQWKK